MHRGSAPVTVVIAARDEGANIQDCIASAAWANEVVVAESGSRDSTAPLARAAGAEVRSGQWPSIGAQRNAAIEAAHNDWIFVLDADERVTPEAAAEIAMIASTDGGFGAYRVRRRNHFLGREIRAGGWQRDRPVRLFRRRFRYNDSLVHEHVVTDGAVGELRNPIAHYPYTKLDQWFAKLDRYSRWWADQQFARGRRASAASVVVRPPLRFLTMFVVRGGWRDGAHGAVLAALAATSVLAKYARLWELSRRARP